MQKNNLLKRFLAFFIDSFFKIPIILFSTFVFHLNILPRLHDPNFLFYPMRMFSYIASLFLYPPYQLFLLYILLIFGLNIYFMLHGQTIGKKIFGIIVVDKNTYQVVSFFKMIIRETIGKYISSILGLGFLWGLIDEDNQCWHDKIINSIVLSVDN